MNTQLKKRLKSFAWRFSGMFVVGLLSILIEPEIAKAVGLSEFLVVIIGLVANEITKYLNKSTN
jgi:hypothetical protein